MTRFHALVVSAAGLVLGAVGPASAAEVHPLVPAEAEQVIFVNFRQIIDSPLIRKFALEQMKQSLQAEAAQLVMTNIGLDPLKDIDELTAAFWAEDPKAPKGLVILTGKFDPLKLFNTADVESKKNPDRLEIVSAGKYKFVRVNTENPNGPGNGPPFKELFVSVPSDGMILACTEKDLLVKTMERVEAKDTKPAIRKSLGSLVVTMDTKASMYMCSLSDPKKIGDIPPNPLFDDPAALKKQLELIETTALTVRVSEDVGVDFIVGMKDANAAEEFAGTVDTILGKVKTFFPLVAGQSPKMKPVLNELSKSLKCEAKNKEVHLTLVVSGKAIAAAATGDPDGDG